MPYSLPSVFDTVPAIIYISDNSTKTICWCNKRLEEESGYTLGEIKEMGIGFFRSVMHPDDFPKAVDAQKEFRSGKTSGFFGHCRIRGRHAKKWKWFIGTAVPYTRNKDGSAQEVICIFLSLEHASNTPEQTEQAVRALKQSVHLLELQLLSERQREVVSLVLEGHSEKMIADKLHIAIRTVEFHLAEIRRKWQVPNMTALAARAKDLGL